MSCRIIQKASDDLTVRSLTVTEHLSACTLDVGADCGSPGYPTGLKLSVDEEGNLRTDGLLLTRDGVNGVVQKDALGVSHAQTVSTNGQRVNTPLPSEP